MLVKILRVDNKGVVVPGLDCNVEPYLKAITKRYKGQTYIQVLCYLHYMTHPYSAYNNFPDNEKEKNILETYPGDYKATDKEIVVAIRELTNRYNTIQKRMYESVKIGVESIISFATTISPDSIVYGKDGNLTEYKTMIKDMPILLDAYVKVEQEYKESIRVKFRGDVDTAYDEDGSYD